MVFLIQVVWIQVGLNEILLWKSSIQIDAQLVAATKYCLHAKLIRKAETHLD